MERRKGGVVRGEAQHREPTHKTKHYCADRVSMPEAREQKRHALRYAARKHKTDREPKSDKSDAPMYATNEHKPDREFRCEAMKPNIHGQKMRHQSTRLNRSPCSNP